MNPVTLVLTALLYRFLFLLFIGWLFMMLFNAAFGAAMPLWAGVMFVLIVIIIARFMR